MQDELEDWFVVLLGPWSREDQPEHDPEMAGVPAEFLRRLRDMGPEWTECGIHPDDTVGCYEDERLRVGIEIGDSEQDVQLAILRVEFSTLDWQGAWADAVEGITAATMTEAQPRGEVVGGPITSANGAHEIDEALRWLQGQLRRPIERLDWQLPGDAEPTGRSWRLADTGESLVTAGKPGQPAGAVARQVRP